nr:AAA family ATPase [Gluconacetobacter dulcium]
MRNVLNTRLDRSYDRSRLSRWENGKEQIPADVEREMQLLQEQRTAKARVVAIANQKGGVGKTTTALNLVSALQRAGQRTLLIDLDPQASATDWLLGQGALEFYRSGRTVMHVLLRGAEVSDAIIRGDEEVGGNVRQFDMLSSHIDLSEADGRREPGFEAALSEAIEPVLDDYDFIVIDAPPNLGLMTYMALVAADMVIVPVQTEPPDAMGVALLLTTVQKVQRRLNPQLRVTGILPTRYNGRQAVDREVLHHLIKYTAELAPVLEPVPDSTVFGNAAWAGAIALDTSPRSKAVQVYVRLAASLATGAPPNLALLNLDEPDPEEDEPPVPVKRKVRA